MARYKTNGQRSTEREVAEDLYDALADLIDLAEGGANRIYCAGACVGCGKARGLSHEAGCKVLDAIKLGGDARNHLDWLART